jgi:hypothetical protein
MRRLASIVIALLFGAAGAGYAAGCAQGDQELFAVELPSGAEGGASHTESPPPAADDASAITPVGDASPAADAIAEDASLPGDASPDATSAADGEPPADAAPPLDAAHPADAAHPIDAAHPVDANSPDANDGGGMSPILSLPPPGSAPCSGVGQDVDCPLGDACLISTPTGGACVSCVACHGYEHSCTKDEDCMPPYQCYANSCSYICELGHHGECGSGQSCVNVGNTSYGICSP